MNFQGYCTNKSHTFFHWSPLPVPRGTKALTELFYVSWSASIALASSHKRHPSSCSPFPTVRFHVVLGLLFSFSLCYVTLVLAILHQDVTNSILYLRHFTSSLSSFILALCNCSLSSLVLSSCSQFIWMELTCFGKQLPLYHLPYSFSASRLRISTASVLYSPSFVFLEMLLNSKSSSV